MKLPSYRRIIKTDYSDDYQALVEKLAVSINNGFDTIYEALNKKLNFTDNISSTISQFTVTVDESGVPSKKTQFKLDKNQETVSGLIVIDCYQEKNTTIPPPSAVFVNFVKSENNILINNIKGLTENTSYVIKVLAIN
jgi:hypothetical protein